MAYVYGESGSENGLRQKCGIKNISELDEIIKNLNSQIASRKESFNIELDKFKADLETKRKEFLKSVPDIIKSKEKELRKIYHKKEVVEKHIQKNIDFLQNKNKKHKKEIKLSKLYILFAIFFRYLKILAERKRKNSESILFLKEIDYVKDEISLLKSKPILIFEKNEDELINIISNKSFENEERELIDKMNVLKYYEKSPNYIGAKGELKVLEQLEKLPEGYNIICDLNLELDNYCYYDGNYDLKSAQMDFVVVCKKGIFLLEVKNWSSSYLNNHIGISPYEQLDRAGRVLYKYLKDNLIDSIDISRKLTKILVPINKNMNYNREYKSVMVKNLHQLNYYIQNKIDVFDEYEVKEIKELLLES